MRYTTLRRTAEGVVLRRYHVRRLQLESKEERRAFDEAIAAATPGIYGVWVVDGAVRLARRERSLLFDGILTRTATSPVANHPGPIPKPAPPGPYDSVRSAGAETLLLSSDLREILEGSCSAVLGWDGERYRFVPDDRPRVWSVAESAIRDHLPAAPLPIEVKGQEPLLLVNAVAGPCRARVSGRGPFPDGAIEPIRGLFRDLTE